jgi:hypothetical protein
MEDVDRRSGLILDVTERKRMEEALRESEEISCRGPAAFPSPNSHAFSGGLLGSCEPVKVQTRDDVRQELVEEGILPLPDDDRIVRSSSSRRSSATGGGTGRRSRQPSPSRTSAISPRTGRWM